MTTFTLIATGTTTHPLTDVEAEVRSNLAQLGVELVPCSWAPDMDTVADEVGVDSVELIDLN